MQTKRMSILFLIFALIAISGAQLTEVLPWLR
jgi:hypothetical protein